MENAFRHVYNESDGLLTIQRVDPADPLIVKDSFTLRFDEAHEVFMTLLKVNNPKFRELAKNFLIGENMVRDNHSTP